VITPLLREQHFGEAEGQIWLPPSADAKPSGPTLDPATGRRVYTVIRGRNAKFPLGESLNDVSQRVGEAFETLIMPLVRDNVDKKAGDAHVFFVSHGIAISECIAFILAKSVNGPRARTESWKGLHNTAWSRLVLGMQGETLIYTEEDASVNGVPHVMADGFIIEDDLNVADEGEKRNVAEEGANPPNSDTEADIKPNLEIVAKVVALNQYPHLIDVVRQRGGIGSMAHDDRQKAITDFFSGGGSQGSADVEEPPKDKTEKIDSDKMEIDQKSGQRSSSPIQE